MGTPFICLHFSSVSSFFLFNLNSIRARGVVWFSLVYHLLCRCVSPHVNMRAGAPADAQVRTNVRAWACELRMSAWALDCSSFQLDLFIFPSYLYSPKGSIPEGSWQFYLSGRVFFVSSCVSVRLSLPSVRLHWHLKLLWLALLLGLECDKLETPMWGD